MLMHRTLTRPGLEPFPDAAQMKAAEALQTAHVDADLELLEADRALRVVDTVLLGGFVGEDARAAPVHSGRGGCAEDDGGVCLFARCGPRFGRVGDRGRSGRWG